jgi:Mg2+ and Co2+ transporter CorA
MIIPSAIVHLFAIILRRIEMRIEQIKTIVLQEPQCNVARLKRLIEKKKNIGHISSKN